MTKRTLAGTARGKAAERIRETAGELFYRQGIRAVGVDEIVTRAGVTKPSLYRSFSSKDELAAAYLRDHGRAKRELFDGVIAQRPQDPRGQFLAWLSDLVARSAQPRYRGCGASNAAVEYPDAKHPARLQAMENKRQFRRQLVNVSHAMGANDPAALADSLLLLIEGVHVSGQLFGALGPSRVAVQTATAIIDASCSAGSLSASI
jgi:AcrR family transcriptional regulator